MKEISRCLVEEAEISVGVDENNSGAQKVDPLPYLPVHLESGLRVYRLCGKVSSLMTLTTRSRSVDTHSSNPSIKNTVVPLQQLGRRYV